MKSRQDKIYSFLRKKYPNTFNRDEISKKTGIPRTSCYNWLNKLVNMGVVERMEFETGRRPQVRYRWVNTK